MVNFTGFFLNKDKFFEAFLNKKTNVH